jgi:hypothetical protein
VATGAYVAFLFHIGVDWDWEMPAVTVAGLACGTALVTGHGRSLPVADRYALGLAALLLCLGVLSAVLGR